MQMAFRAFNLRCLDSSKILRNEDMTLQRHFDKIGKTAIYF